MIFNSVEYFIFLPIVVSVYYLLPLCLRNIWLLAVSYYFYMNWNLPYSLLLIFVTLVSYTGGILIGYLDRNEEISQKSYIYKRFVLFACILLTFSLLVYFKYANFFINHIKRIFDYVGMGSDKINALDIILPVGISFYTFQAVGYIVDVYRKQTKAEINFLRYALFLSFFPQLVAGPIERSNNLLRQLNKSVFFDIDNIRLALLRIFWGLFIKIVIADNLAVIIDKVYSDYSLYYGCEIFFATMLFAFQIYCDFEGYSSIARGSANMFGINLMQNFNAPYLAQNVTEFWRRWHISLTEWFRDYIYIPLGGNRKGTVKKQFNTLIVFLTSGLWHGAGFSFIVWGGLNGLYIILEDLYKKLINRLKPKAGLVPAVDVVYLGGGCF